METLITVAVATTLGVILLSIFYLIYFKLWNWLWVNPLATLVGMVAGIFLLLLVFYLQWYWFIIIYNIFNIINMLIGWKVLVSIFKSS